MFIVAFLLVLLLTHQALSLIPLLSLMSALDLVTFTSGANTANWKVNENIPHTFPHRINMADGPYLDIRVDINMSGTPCDGGGGGWGGNCLRAELTIIYFIWGEMWIWKEYLVPITGGATQFIGCSAKQHRQRFIVCSPAWVFKLNYHFQTHVSG